jgi:hypothetical protein
MKPVTLRSARLVSIVLASGCSAYVYRPTEYATSRLRGHAAARYDVPPERPEGSVRVASFGVARVTRVRATATDLRAMHVRMVVENNSAQPWLVDTGRLTAAVRGAAPVRPAAVRSEAQDLPRATVPAGGARTLDLFFPLPADAQAAGKIPSFDFSWEVQTDDRAIAERTPFERLNVVPYYASAGPFLGPYRWGSYGWYESDYRSAIIAWPSWVW